MAKKERLPDDAVSLCPEELPAGLLPWIMREVIGRDDTLIYRRGNVRGLCYACRRQVRAIAPQRFRQNERTDCPNCGARVTCYREYGQPFRVDYVSNVAALQKGADGETVFVRLWHVLRDPEARYEQPGRWLEEIARYAIRGKLVGKWQMEEKNSFNFGKVERWRNSHWVRHEGVTRIYDGEYKLYTDYSALAGTPLQYAALERYMEQQPYPNAIRYLADYARYPVLEYLTKRGYIGLVGEKCGTGIDNKYRGAILWERTRLQDCFRFPLRLLDMKEPEQWQVRDVSRLNELWRVHKAGAITEAEVREIFEEDVKWSCISQAAGYAAAHKVVKYIVEQQKREGLYVQRDYRDYINECMELRLDLTDKRVLFPRDLRAAHARTTEMVDYERNKADAEAFAAAAQKLDKLAWAHGGLAIRPARSQAELKAEGAALHHCVAGYAKRMAAGETGIFLIRRADSPDEPYYTLELRGKDLIQCRTKHNASYTQDPEVKAFVDAWMAEVVAHGGKKKKRKAA